ncbi:MAG: Hsp20/alpha crystallin family protein [Isosphaeraceae bacterium]
MNGHGWQRRWDPFRELEREVGRLFSSFEPLQTWRMARQFPPVNLYDASDRYILTVAVPGMTPGDIDLSITGETLTLRGERRRPEGVSDESYRRQERPFGRWMRTVTLPDRVEGGEVSAAYANGVLTVTLPKAESARPRQITVAAS